MSWKTANHFVERHGFEKLVRLVKALSDPDAHLEQIADRFNFSPAYVCELRQKLMRRVYVPAEQVKLLLETFPEVQKSRREEQDKLIKEANDLAA